MSATGSAPTREETTFNSESKLDAIISAALRSFCKDIEGWHGREREMVSLFCFGHLISHCRTGGLLFDRGQVGIEVAVRQLPADVLEKLRCKSDVCKDVVIWPKPKMTVWDNDLKPRREPLSVMEWKVVNRLDDKRQQTTKLAEHESDKQWLRETSRRSSEFTGYAVLVNSKTEPRTLICSSVRSGEIQERWIVLPSQP
jgi:hypothetical protein